MVRINEKLLLVVIFITALIVFEIQFLYFGSNSSATVATIPPTGDLQLHKLMVQYISESEPRYLRCMTSRHADQCPVGPFMFMDIMRRLLDYRVNRNEKLQTVQIGCFDGKSNDPIYEAFVRPHVLPKRTFSSPKNITLSDWKAILVEPIFMNALKSTYKEIYNATDALPCHFHFSSSIITDSEDNIKNGECTFYDVAPKHKTNCTNAKDWLKQISGTKGDFIRKTLQNKFDDCVEVKQVKCLTLPQLFNEAGISITKSKDTSLYCSNDPLARVDMLVVDTEGTDGMIVVNYLKTMCKQLWPVLILYEDKVMRYHNTVSADDTIRFLEKSGYYIQLTGEDALAYHVGYSVSDFRHIPYPELYPCTWCHPNTKQGA